jgi:hypothetical protein
MIVDKPSLRTVLNFLVYLPRIAHELPIDEQFFDTFFAAALKRLCLDSTRFTRPIVTHVQVPGPERIIV